MAVITKILNGTNLTRDAGIQEIPTALLDATGGVRIGYGNECLPASGQVGTGIVYVPVTRTTVTPNESFLVALEVTETFTLDTSGNGYIIASVDQSKINDGSSNSEDGSGIATIEKVGSLPSGNYVQLATISGGTVTPARTFAQLSALIHRQAPYFKLDTGSADAYVTTDSKIFELTDGCIAEFRAGNTNTGASTFNYNSTGAKSIRKNYNATLDAGDIQEDQIIILRYDATNDWWQMMSQLGSTLAVTNTVKVSSNDSSAGYLEDKIVGGFHITTETLNDGSDEDVQINNYATGTCGETLSPDDWVYVKVSDKRLYKATNNIASVAESWDVIGVIVSGGTAGNSCTYIPIESINIWTTSALTDGEVYWLGTGGALTTTPPSFSSATLIPVCIGRARNTTELIVKKKRHSRVFSFSDTLTINSTPDSNTHTYGIPEIGRIDLHFSASPTLTTATNNLKGSGTQINKAGGGGSAGAYSLTYPVGGSPNATSGVGFFNFAIRDSSTTYTSSCTISLDGSDNILVQQNAFAGGNTWTLAYQIVVTEFIDEPLE